MDRREFLKISGVGAAGLGLQACKPELSGNDSVVSEPSGKIIQNYAGVGLLGYGCMRWPLDDAGEIDQEEVNSLVDLALRHGVNYFDSAPVYLKGKSEAATAAALRRHPREEYLIATKLSNHRGSSHTMDFGIRMYRRSLEIYDTDHIDYYLLHNLGGYENFRSRFVDNGLLDFLLAEREAGRIRNLGWSYHGDRQGFDAILDLHSRYHWDFVQIQMNYMDWTHAGGGNTDADHLYSSLASLDIPVVIMEPLLGGRLASVPSVLSDRLKSREPSRSIASWAFRFCGSFPKVLTILSGMTYREHLLDNLSTFTDFKPLTGEELNELEDIACLMDKYPLVRCTACNYCMPCPYGIDIPGIFKFYNDNVNSGTYVTGPEQEHYARLRRKYLLNYDKSVPTIRQASHCIHCGKCLDKCPQHIGIPSQMERIDNYIEQLKREKL